MTTDSRMERDITDALDAEVAGAVPTSLLDDIVSTTGRMRPLPRWLALLKEPPMRIHHKLAVGSPTVRLIGIMALTMALALATAGAVAVGASLLPEPPKPPPFGLAANGALYYSDDGDIFRAEADGSNPVAIVTGDTNDRFPGLSRDGTRMIFLRGEETGESLDATLAKSDGTVIRDLGPVSTWFDFSPDDSLLAVCCDGGSIATMTLDGVRTPLDLGGLEPVWFVSWRPTDGHEIIFLAHPEATPTAIGLYAIAPDGSGLRQIGDLDTDIGEDNENIAFSNLQLSPDGVTAAYWDWEVDSRGVAGPLMHLLDLDTGEQLPVPFAPADGHGVTPQFSPDGRWVVFEAASGRPGETGALFYAPRDGSLPSREIGPQFDYTYRDGFSFLPDGTKVLLALKPDSIHPSVLIDVETGAATELQDIADQDRTWQRLAP